jgi:hypothetical protein
MPVIPPSRSEPYQPPGPEVHAPDEERLTTTGSTEKTVLVIVAIMLFIVILVTLALPHSPFAE